MDPVRAQCFAQPRRNHRHQVARASKAHLDLARVDVHIHFGGIDAHLEHHHRVPPLGDDAPVSLVQRPVEDRVPNEAPIDEQVGGPGPAAAMDPDRARQPAHLESEVAEGHRDQGAGLVAQQVSSAHRPICGDGGTHHLSPVVDHQEIHLGPHQRLSGHRFDAVAQLGGRGAQELPSHRQVVEQGADIDFGTGGAAGVDHLGDLPSLHPHPGPHLPVPGTGGELEPAYRGNRRQCLPSEAQGPRRHQVVHVADLARRVPFKAHDRVVPVHAVAVVGDPHQGPSASPQGDSDGAAASIERVLDQLLHHRGRPLHHLTGCDLVDQPVREDADAHCLGSPSLRRFRKCSFSGVPSKSNSCRSRLARYRR